MGGTVVAKIVDQKAITDRAYYRVLFSVVSNTDLKMTQRGHLVIFAKPESILSFGIRHFGSLFRRELSF